MSGKLNEVKGRNDAEIKGRRALVLRHIFSTEGPGSGFAEPTATR